MGFDVKFVTLFCKSVVNNKALQLTSIYSLDLIRDTKAVH